MSHKFTVLNGGKNKARTKGKGFEPEAEERLDLNRYLMKHPVATFYVRVEGDSMIGAGINPGDILVVDRAVTARHGDIIIARVEDELYVKRLHIEQGKTMLIPENPAYEPFRITEEMDFESWGTAMHVIHTFRREDD